MQPITPARLELSSEGVPYSSQFDDIYHSRGGGLAQAREVFMAGNGLPAAWRGHEHFTILETGFGQGLSFLATWQTWAADPQRCARLHFVSIEQFPFTRDDLAQLHAHYPEIASEAAALRAAWPWLTPGVHRVELAGGKVILTLVLGEAGHWLPQLELAADAIYLDGFAPDKNPELWCEPIYRQLRRLAHDHTTLATYTVAGHVRRGLTAAGFSVERVAGFAGKRQMLRGTSTIAAQWRNRRPTRPASRQAIVIGAGMAGAACAWQLARRGWQVTILEQASQIASGSSGNHVGLMHPTFSRDDNLQARLTRAGCALTLQVLRQLDSSDVPVPWGNPGQLQVAKNAEQLDLMATLSSELAIPDELARFVTAEQLNTHYRIASGGLFYKASAWIHPPGLCRALLAHPGITVKTGQQVARLQRNAERWILLGTDETALGESETVILANATAAARLCPQAELPLSDSLRVVSRIPATELSEPPFSLSGPSYLTPAYQGLRCVGAAELAAGEDEATAAARNLAGLRKVLPDLDVAGISLHDWRCCPRPASPDRLPLIGALPVPGEQHSPAHQLWQLARLPGLYGALGFGARGLTWCMLAGELIASQLSGEPLPLDRALLDAVDPGRFALRALRRKGSRSAD
ncbi:bifunctional tRNA (5-methylaminomethyl-2-thiouridine)(34)-methyltransferase MnmD/FAD-dependent 5-carboxymethylaminomethyl-2-thiouridine(34) oxidoreductase MnmC [Chitinilyticum piscinae]|uniref:tRNA 5-methylaminomethyl-2-thiouridine biosynthesis bifunctional protein MnmC n=1 Tax=Chitinilyticum piscinae TaxID=2866724 RepID=A0A8J7FR76_9NEIS|nr:bifunctional tRNA (5-methylaminomethyl-2-thiouridine)(34)-methyltransferase MnmD/FAD-dependent 5-carboxymethylaminomethyl-2-thiouridine(34) oxidoreductase MnmC [Chitinilyticum piscinae]MBE9609336.1 bifunctional tRNA (5-methylaminomethyl-2-thiouridine)(34)-methyltransferase MnmD/FAD-dependent 5-carboxymethylaminomethyl-2-thiouridine(34) oxidoreductase MnmC [Chitinilyticum piscinae]